ncbi:MAG: DoxX family membrane protein [Phycisphaerae bacterium]|nr:DoxX family membrane protein [Saprospiraceae bacterium]
MNAFLSLGRWLFAIPFAILGLINFLSTRTMVETFVPNYLPAPTAWVLVGGAGLVAASISMLIGKYDKLACTLLAIYLLAMVVLVHLSGAMAGSLSAQFLLFKDLALAGAAMMYAQHLSKDRSVIG